MITYRKNNKQKWVAFGPVSEVRLGTVKVSKRSGEVKTETVESLGRPFVVDGVPHIYGYLMEAHTTTSYAAPKRRKARFVPCGYPGCNPTHCDECDGDGHFGTAY